jgi:hypothetical protein
MLKTIGKTLVSATKTIGTIVWMTPGLALQKRRAITIFQSELRAYGLDNETIQELTKTYRQMGEIKHWVSNINNVS